MRKPTFCFLFVLLAACQQTPTSPSSQAAVQTSTSVTATTTMAATIDVPATSASTTTESTPTSATETTATFPSQGNEPTAQSLSVTHTIVDTSTQSTHVVDSHTKADAAAPKATQPVTTAPAPSTVVTPSNTATADDHHLQLKQAHKLEPFKASFRIYVSKIPMPITAELELSPQKQPDTWKMRFEISSFMMHNLEESSFQWNNCHPKSIHYHHDFKGFGKRQSHDTDFFWNPPHVQNHSSEDSKTFAIPADAVDDLTVLLQAACALGEGQTDYYATSIYGSQIRDNHFIYLRNEVIDTPLGKLDTLVIEKERSKKKTSRHTLFWVAPSLNYMLVKAKHIENTALFGEVIMKSYTGPHQ